MQISRHWRLNAQRYRLEGVRREDGTVSLQERPTRIMTRQVPATSENNDDQKKVVISQRLAS